MDPQGVQTDKNDLAAAMVSPVRCGGLNYIRGQPVYRHDVVPTPWGPITRDELWLAIEWAYRYIPDHPLAGLLRDHGSVGKLLEWEARLALDGTFVPPGAEHILRERVRDLQPFSVRVAAYVELTWFRK